MVKAISFTEFGSGLISPAKHKNIHHQFNITRGMDFQYLTISNGGHGRKGPIKSGQITHIGGFIEQTHCTVIAVRIKKHMRCLMQQRSEEDRNSLSSLVVVSEPVVPSQAIVLHPTRPALTVRHSIQHARQQVGEEQHDDQELTQAHR